MLCPRVDGVRYSAGALPEKIGRFVPNIPKQGAEPGTSQDNEGSAGAQTPQSGQQQTNRTQSTGPTLVEYLPHDREEAIDEHLKDLRQRLDEERRGHTAAKQQLKNLRELEQEEYLPHDREE